MMDENSSYCDKHGITNVEKTRIRIARLRAKKKYVRTSRQNVVK